MASVRVRVDKSFEDFLNGYRKEMRKVINRDLTHQEITKIISQQLHNPFVVKRDKLIGTSILIDGSGLEPIMERKKRQRKKKKIVQFELEMPLFVRG